MGILTTAAVAYLGGAVGTVLYFRNLTGGRLFPDDVPLRVKVAALTMLTFSWPILLGADLLIFRRARRKAQAHLRAIIESGEFERRFEEFRAELLSRSNAKPVNFSEDYEADALKAEQMELPLNTEAVNDRSNGSL